MLKLFIVSFVVSLAVAYFILRAASVHPRLRSDTARPGSHKIHDESVPRIGGIAIVAGWLFGLALACYLAYVPSVSAAGWFASLLPVFLAGLAEDFTGRVSARARLLCSMVSAAAAYALLDVAAKRLDVPGLDALLALPLVSFAFTLLAIAGVAHAVNIIDGLHGLALNICIMSFGAMGYVAFQVGDTEILLLSGFGAAGALGLRAWNYPSGHIFCGDGGAYFMGAYLAMLAGLLVARNDQVSAWFPVVTLFYPIWETMFSVYRRKCLQKVAASAPDKLHMHTLMFDRMANGRHVDLRRARARRNSDASHTMALLALLNVVPALLWWNYTPCLVASALGFALVYVLVYRTLVKKLSATPLSAARGALDMPVERTSN